MNKKWPKAKLGEVLRHRKEFITIDDLTNYKRPRVQLHVQGIVLRDEVLGALIKTKAQQICRAGEFLVAEIDAKVGGFGLVPESLEGSIVSSHYFLFVIDETKLDREFLDYFIQTPAFIEQVTAKGSTNYAAIRPSHVLGYEIPLPSLAEQRQVVNRIKQIASQLFEARKLRLENVDAIENLFISKLRAVVQENKALSKQLPFTEITKLERRPADVQLEGQYREIGVYCFGKGIFHKPARSGAEVGEKDLCEIRDGDFILQITFAWEGAVALAGKSEDGMFGSVRYLTFRVNEDICSPRYLLTYMKTPEAIAQLERISPGSAGRNRVLSVKRLNEVMVPIVPLEAQKWLNDTLHHEVETLKRLQADTAIEMDALLPSILDRAFKGEL